jgi:hypothetical protein
VLYRKYKYKMIQSPSKEWYFLNNLRKKGAAKHPTAKSRREKLRQCRFFINFAAGNESPSKPHHTTSSKQHQDA